MRAIIQRVTSASVTVHNTPPQHITAGLVILLGIASDDTEHNIDWLVNKIVHLRIFEDEQRKMNKSLLDINGEVLLVSQFTLFASTKKGTRPSFSNAAEPALAIPRYEQCVQRLSAALGQPVKTGQFGADMQVEIHNDGPVTIILDTKAKE